MNKFKKIVGISAGAAGLVTLSMGAAFAAHTVVTVGGNSGSASVPVSGVNTSQIDFETDWGVPTWCNDSTITGTVLQGASVEVGETVGYIDDLLLEDCYAVSNLPVEIEMGSGAEFVVTAHPTNPGDPVQIEVTGIDAHMHSTGATPWACELQATGSVTGTITPGSGGVDGSISINSPSFSLDIVALDGNNTGTPSGSGLTCGGQIGTGDSANMNGAFELDTNGAGAISHG